MSAILLYSDCVAVGLVFGTARFGLIAVNVMVLVVNGNSIGCCRLVDKAVVGTLMAG